MPKAICAKTARSDGLKKQSWSSLNQNNETGNEACKIYDCFLFFKEFDILDIRLNELYDSVDYFIIVEAPETFRGNPKPLYYQENQARYEKFSDKIIHIVAGKFKTKNPWKREEFQRNQIMQGLKNCHPDDLIMISDVDEIVRATTIPAVMHALNTEKKRSVVLEQHFYRYYLNAYYNYWVGTCAMKYGVLAISKPDIMRIKRNNYPVIPNGGWHLTSMGGLSAVKYKFESYSHTEHDTPKQKSQAYIDSVVKNECQIVEIDDIFPRYISDHLDYFRDMGFIYPTIEVLEEE